jgi:DNA-binding transcriptional regulator WhiA
MAAHCFVLSQLKILYLLYNTSANSVESNNHLRVPGWNYMTLQQALRSFPLRVKCCSTKKTKLTYLRVYKAILDACQKLTVAFN